LSDIGAQVYVELWVSLASLLRSYTSMHGLNGNRQATVELGEERILVRHGEQWMELDRDRSQVTWKREDGRSGTLELTEHGRLRSRDPRSENPDRGHPDSVDEEEMDVAAERWARELMR
jgi:hypothetical protein